MNQTGPLNGLSAEKIKALAQSEAGKKLMALLQETKGQELQKAMEQAASGNYDAVKQTVSALLNDRQTRTLVEEMRD